MWCVDVLLFMQAQGGMVGLPGVFEDLVGPGFELVEHDGDVESGEAGAGVVGLLEEGFELWKRDRDLFGAGGAACGGEFLFVCVGWDV